MKGPKVEPCNHGTSAGRSDCPERSRRKAKEGGRTRFCTSTVDKHWLGTITKSESTSQSKHFYPTKIRTQHRSLPERCVRSPINYKPSGRRGKHPETCILPPPRNCSMQHILTCRLHTVHGGCTGKGRWGGDFPTKTIKKSPTNSGECNANAARNNHVRMALLFRMFYTTTTFFFRSTTDARKKERGTLTPSVLLTYNATRTEKSSGYASLLCCCSAKDKKNVDLLLSGLCPGIRFTHITTTAQNSTVGCMISLEPLFGNTFLLPYPPPPPLHSLTSLVLTHA